MMLRSNRFAAAGNTVLCLLFLLLPAGATAQERTKIAVKAGRIIPMKGEEIQDGVILVDEGKITAVGKDVEIPYDFWVLDAGNLTAFPGMVEPFTSRGLDRANESLPVTPFLDVYDAIDPSSTAFEDALRDGITTLLVSQGPDTVIGGIARAVRPVGMTVDAMTVRAEAGIILSFRPKRNTDRMIQMAAFRETFRELDRYRDDLAEKKYAEKLESEGKTLDVGPEEAAKRGRPLLRDEDYDFKHRNLVRLVEGRLRAFLYCARPVDVIHALDTAAKHGFLERSVLVLENPCWKAADRIKASGRPVILDADLVYREKDPFTGEEKEVFVPSVFYEAGIPFAVRSDPSQAFGTRYLWYQAARLVRNGIPREAALRAVTWGAAEIIGLGDRKGALAPGMDGDVLLLSGDPLDGGTWVEKVLIQGKVVYEREKDPRLEELFSGREAAPAEGEKEKEGKKGEGDRGEGKGSGSKR